MKAFDLSFVDIETTGLDARLHEIIEIAVVRVRQNWPEDGTAPSFDTIFEWSIKVRPTDIASADPASLKINGYSPSDWKDSSSLEEALRAFSEKTEGSVMVAHNVVFDAGFLEEHMSRLGIANKMHYHRLDTISMAFAVLHSVPDATRYSLGELCKYFNIKNERPHSALSDARATLELFKKLVLS